MASAVRQFENSRVIPFFIEGEKGFLEEGMTPFLEKAKIPFLQKSKIALLRDIDSKLVEVVALQQVLKSFPPVYAQGIELTYEIGGMIQIMRLQAQTFRHISSQRIKDEIIKMQGIYAERGPKVEAYRDSLTRVNFEIERVIQILSDVRSSDTRVLETTEIDSITETEKVYDFCQGHLAELRDWLACGTALDARFEWLMERDIKNYENSMEKFMSEVNGSNLHFSQLVPLSLYRTVVHSHLEVEQGIKTENLHEMFDQMHLEESSTTDVKAASMKPEEIKAYLKEVCILINTTAKKFSLEINFKEILELCEFNEKELIRSSDPQLHGRLLDYIEQLKNDNLILLSPSEKPVGILKGIQDKLIMFLAKKIKQYLGKNEKVFFRKITAGEELRFHELLQQISPTYSPNEKKINNPASSNLQKLIDNNFSSYSKPKKDPHKIFLFEKLIALEALCQELTAK